MVDIHCHILPGIDDGSPDLETSLAMCRAAASEGVTHVVGSPHLSDQYEFSAERNRKLRDELQRQCGPRPELLLGCDFHLNDINLELLQASPASYTINQGSYLLVENSNYSLPPNLERMFFQLRMNGILPVLTHPERNPLWQSKPDALKRLVEQECVIQITAGSLTGRFGRPSQKHAMDWLKQGLVHVVASDAHNMRGRPYKMKDAFDVVVKETDAATADLLFQENPYSVTQSTATRRPTPPKKRLWGLLR